MMIFLGICIVILLLSIAISVSESDSEYARRMYVGNTVRFEYKEEPEPCIRKGIFNRVESISTMRAGEIRLTWDDDSSEIVPLAVGSDVGVAVAKKIEILSGSHTLIFKGKEND